MSPAQPGRLTARLALLLAAAWIAAGALFKLLLGSPNDLPPVLRQLPIPLGTLFPLAIGIELAVVCAALLRPRLGWKLVALQYCAFAGVLIWLLLEGAESCGCFGSKVKIAPAVMLAIDGGLLLALLATRPWRAFDGAGSRPGLPLPVALLPMAALLGLPFVLSREVKAPREGNLGLQAQGAAAKQGHATAPAETPQNNGAGVQETPAPAEPAAVTEPKSGPLPSQGYVIVDVEKWVGKSIFDTELAKFLPVEELPGDGLWVFWRITCDHCRDHLLELMNTERGERPLVLVRVRGADDYAQPHIVEFFPSGPHVHQVELPEGYDWVIQTPAELELSNYTVTRGKEAVK